MIRAKVAAQRMQETLGAGSRALFFDPILHLAYSNPKKEAFQVENQWKTIMCHNVSSIQVAIADTLSMAC